MSYSAAITHTTTPDTLQSANTKLKLAVVSDAAAHRNGVGAYYADLVEELGNSPSVIAILFCPPQKTAGWQRYLAAPLPGDSTQRVSLPNAKRLLREVQKLQPDAIVVPTPGPYGLLGLFIAKRFKIPLIVGFHTHYEALAEMYWKDLFGNVCQYYLGWCNRLLFRHSSLVLANSPEMCEQATQQGAISASIMGTPIDSLFLNTPRVPTRRTPSKLVFAGRLAVEKNIPVVLETAKLNPAIEFHIVGDGPMRKHVEQAQEKSNNIYYHGWLDRHSLMATIDHSDALLLPSKVESFGTVALEAMARGRPAIVSSTCGIAQWPRLKEGLIVISEGKSLSDTVNTFVNLSYNERLQLSNSAHRLATDFNQWNLVSWKEWIAVAGGGPDVVGPVFNNINKTIHK